MDNKITKSLVKMADLPDRRGSFFDTLEATARAASEAAADAASSAGALVVETGGQVASTSAQLASSGFDTVASSSSSSLSAATAATTAAAGSALAAPASQSLSANLSAVTESLASTAANTAGALTGAGALATGAAAEAGSSAGASVLDGASATLAAVSDPAVALRGGGNEPETAEAAAAAVLAAATSVAVGELKNELEILKRVRLFSTMLFGHTFWSSSLGVISLRYVTIFASPHLLRRLNPSLLPAGRFYPLILPTQALQAADCEVASAQLTVALPPSAAVSVVRYKVPFAGRPLPPLDTLARARGAPGLLGNCRYWPLSRCSLALHASPLSLSRILTTGTLCCRSCLPFPSVPLTAPVTDPATTASTTLKPRR